MARSAPWRLKLNPSIALPRKRKVGIIALREGTLHPYLVRRPSTTQMKNEERARINRTRETILEGSPRDSGFRAIPGHWLGSGVGTKYRVLCIWTDKGLAPVLGSWLYESPILCGVANVLTVSGLPPYSQHLQEAIVHIGRWGCLKTRCRRTKSSCHISGVRKSRASLLWTLISAVIASLANSGQTDRQQFTDSANVRGLTNFSLE